MQYNVILYEKIEKIAVITFNRPHVYNALNRDVNLRLVELLSQAENDDEVRVVLLTGAGEKAFVAGGDVKEMIDMDPMNDREYALQAKRAVDKIYSLKKPIIMPHKTPDSCLVMEWLPEGLKRSLKRKKPPTPVGGGSLPQLTDFAWAGGWNTRWPVIFGWDQRMPSSACPKLTLGSCPGPAGPKGSRGSLVWGWPRKPSPSSNVMKFFRRWQSPPTCRKRLQGLQ